MKAAVFLIAAVAHAQWLSYPTPGVPRTADGKPDLSAPAPRTSDGKPDLSGVWIPRSGYTSNIAKDLKPGEVPFSPEALARDLADRGTRARAVSGYDAVAGILPGLMKGRTLVVTLSNGSMDGLPLKISSEFGVRSSGSGGAGR